MQLTTRFYDTGLNVYRDQPTYGMFIHCPLHRLGITQVRLTASCDGKSVVHTLVVDDFGNLVKFDFIQAGASLSNVVLQ